MGIIRNQSIKNSISLYIGIAIGAINTVLIFPHVFEDNVEYWGLLQILVSYSVIFSSFSHLGTPSILLRFFPKVNSKADLISFSLILCAIGFVLFFLLFSLFKSYLLSYLDGSPLLLDNFHLVLVFVFCISFFDVLSSLSRSYLDSATPVFLNEVFLRVCIFILLFIYKYEYITFNQFLVFYTSFYIVKLVLLAFYLWKKSRLTFAFSNPNSSVKEQIKYGLYVLTGGGAAILVSRFDMLMIEYYLDLKQVAYYGLAFFIGSVIKIPARSLSSISSPLIALAFDNKNVKEIETIYKKSSINLLLIGLIIFFCIWLNVDHILLMLPEKFHHGKYVILFVGLAQIFNLATGVNGSIIINSDFYKFDMVLNVILLVLTVVTNILLIPIYGINGAALATAISIFSYNLVKLLLVKFKLNIQPFSIKTITSILLFSVIYLIVYSIPLEGIHSLLIILIRCSFILILCTFSILYFKLSEDVYDFCMLLFRKAGFIK